MLPLLALDHIYRFVRFRSWLIIFFLSSLGSIPKPPQPFSAPVAAIGLKEIYDGNFTIGVLSEHNLAKENDGYICQYNGIHSLNERKAVATIPSLASFIQLIIRLFFPH